MIKNPDYDFINLKQYQASGYRWNSPPKPNAPLSITRGCPYRCQFCAAPQLNGLAIRKHSVEYMMDLIQRLYTQGTRWFNIIDDNFTFDTRYAKSFCEAVIKLNLKDAGFGTPNGIRMGRGDAELWRLMKQAGWRHLIVAPESGSAHTLELMKKDLKLDTIPRIVEEIRAAGLTSFRRSSSSVIREKPPGTLGNRCFDSQMQIQFCFPGKFPTASPERRSMTSWFSRGRSRDWLLPHNFSDGVRTYTPPEFEGFNFSRFILRMHLSLMAHQPFNIPYQIGVLFRLFKPSVVLKKLWLNVTSILRPGRQQKKALVFKPMHEQTTIAMGSLKSS